MLCYMLSLPIPHLFMFGSLTEQHTILFSNGIQLFPTDGWLPLPRINFLNTQQLKRNNKKETKRNNITTSFFICIAK